MCVWTLLDSTPLCLRPVVAHWRLWELQVSYPQHWFAHACNTRVRACVIARMHVCVVMFDVDIARECLDWDAYSFGSMLLCACLPMLL